MLHNRGFSLVELIITMAIAAIAGLAIFGFMNYSTGTYKKSDQEVKIQYEQQLVVNQIKDIILESTNGIFFDNSTSTLTIYNKIYNENKYSIIKLHFDDSNNTLLLGKKVFNNIADINSSIVPCSEILSKKIKNFTVDTSKIKKNKISFVIIFENGDEELTASPVILLRNHIIASDDIAILYKENSTVVNNYLKGISILRDGKVFASGSQDQIGKYGNTVTIQYSAEVQKTSDSLTEESVIWTLSEAVAGVSVDKDNGTVTITKDVPKNTVFTLHVNCLSDANIKNSLSIKVVDDYPYPEKVTLRQMTPDKQNGYTNVTLVPTISYTNHKEESTNLDLVEFKGDITNLPTGCSFDTKTGILTLVESANDKTFKIWSVSKERGVEGKGIISNYVEVVVGKINPYIPEPSISLAVNRKINRGSDINIKGTWMNQTDTNCYYKWEVKPIENEDGTNYWITGQNNDLNSFYNMYFSNTLGQYDCITYNNPEIQLTCNQKLNWNRSFRIKISVEAYSNQTKELIDADEMALTIEPVKISLEPASWTGKGNDIYPLSDIMQVDYNYKNYNSRIFKVILENIVINTSIKYDVKNIYNLYNIEGQIVTTSSYPSLLYKNISFNNGFVGFSIPRKEWKQDANRVTSFDYGVVLSSNDGNVVGTTLTSKKTFKVIY